MKHQPTDVQCETTPQPWQEVIRIEVLKGLSGGRMITYNHLSCGHTTRHTGDAAIAARYAKRRRCKICKQQEN